MEKYQDRIKTLLNTIDNKFPGTLPAGKVFKYKEGGMNEIFYRRYSKI
jgi:hypothetical protein